MRRTCLLAGLRAVELGFAACAGLSGLFGAGYAEASIVVVTVYVLVVCVGRHSGLRIFRGAGSLVMNKEKSLAWRVTSLSAFT